MNDLDITLSSVNWEHGMLVTPDHFLRQERYFDSALLWLTRYMSDAHGLVGCGPRQPEGQRGTSGDDPKWTLSEDDTTLYVSVTQCRGITPGGCIIDVNSKNTLEKAFPKTELEGFSESKVYVVCDPNRKQVFDGIADEANPQIPSERRPEYDVELRVPAAEIPYSLVVGKVRRAPHGTEYERTPDFIPACTTLVAHSALNQAWQDIKDTIHTLTKRYARVHSAIQRYVHLLRDRGLETEMDIETLAFAGRMVVALESCLFEILDPLQPPRRFLGQLKRFFHSAATYLDLSVPVQQYYESLMATGGSQYQSLVQQQKLILETTPRWETGDLAVELRSAQSSLDALVELELALEGKYLDFRTNRMIEAVNFVFDLGAELSEPRLYRMVARPSRPPQISGSDRTVVFSKLSHEGRRKYRIILVGEPKSILEPGTPVEASIHINEGSGFRGEPMYLRSEAKVPNQCNVELDFDLPGVQTLTDLRVTIPGHLPFRTALLFVREYFVSPAAYDVRRPSAQTRPSEPTPDDEKSGTGSQPSGDRQREEGRSRGRFRDESHERQSQHDKPADDRFEPGGPDRPRRRRFV